MGLRRACGSLTVACVGPPGGLTTSHLAVDGAHALSQPGQAAAARLVRAAAPVVGHPQHERLAVLGELDA